MDPLYDMIAEAIAWAQAHNLRVQPDNWGVECVDGDGELTQDWRAFADNVCPLGALIMQRQPSPHIQDNVVLASAELLAQEEWFVDGFVDGFDGRPLKLPSYGFYDEGELRMGWELGHRFRQELGLETGA